MEKEKNIKYSMLDEIIKNALEIETELDSLQETTKIDGEDLESKIKQIELNSKFTILKRNLDTIKQFAQGVIELDQFEDKLNQKIKI